MHTKKPVPWLCTSSFPLELIPSVPILEKEKRFRIRLIEVYNSYRALIHRIMWRHWFLGYTRIKLILIRKTSLITHSSHNAKSITHLLDTKKTYIHITHLHVKISIIYEFLVTPLPLSHLTPPPPSKLKNPAHLHPNTPPLPPSI